MDTSTGGSIPGPRCCCGSPDCAFLAHNGRLLDGLERDVSKAAQLGQVRGFQSLMAALSDLTAAVAAPHLCRHVAGALALANVFSAGSAHPP